MIMDDGVSPTWGMIILLVLILIDFIIYGFVAAMDKINAVTVEKMAKEGSKRAELLQKYQEKSERYINVCQLMILVLHMMLGFFEVTLWKRMFVPADAAWWLSLLGNLAVFVVLILFVLIVGIYTPQKVAARKPEQWAILLVRPVHALEILFFPAIALTDLLANLLSRIFGVDPLSDTDDVTEEEIISMVKEGHEQGVLLASEAEMIHNIFEFGDKEAKDIMTHRKNIAAISGNMTFHEMIDFVKESNYSRFPVYEDNIDNIIGVLHIKDALNFCQRQELFGWLIKDVEGLLHEVDFIPETRNINTLFTMMQTEKSHMVIVVDEYGQTSGLVAMEDILEEIVGNIEDEHDDEETMIEQFPDGTYRISGMADYGDVLEVLEIERDEEESDHFDTLNGFLISQIDKIPEDDELFSVTAFDYMFEVTSVENKMIQSVRVSRCSREDVKEETCQKSE